MSVSYFIKQMRNHCEAGMKIPAGDSAERALSRKEELMRTVDKIQDGDREFKNEKKKFARHVVEFKNHYKSREEKLSC